MTVVQPVSQRPALALRRACDPLNAELETALDLAQARLRPRVEASALGLSAVRLLYFVGQLIDKPTEGAEDDCSMVVR